MSAERLDYATNLFEQGDPVRASEVLRREVAKAKAANDDQALDAILDVASEQRERLTGGERRALDRVIADIHGEEIAPVGTTMPSDVKTPDGHCRNCGKTFGGGVVCQFCNQVEGLPVSVTLASSGRRFGGYMLEIVLLIVTLIIGYIVWSFIIYGRGQTPPKQLLHMRIIRLDSGTKTSWGRTFLREWPCKFVIGVLAFFTLGIPYFWLLWDKKNQELWDKMVNTVVVYDPDGLTSPRD